MKFSIQRTRVQRILRHSAAYPRKHSYTHRKCNNSYGLNGDDHHYPVPPPPPPHQVKRELPSDLSKEELIKEAEKVIAQTERIKCTVDTPSSLAGIRLQEKLLEDRKFSSLPHRKKKSSKPLGRSVSDASQKKPKRPSIFNLFSKRSDPNLSTVSQGTATDSPRSGKRSAKPVGRSKSDVGYNSSSTPGNNSLQSKSQTLDRKRIKIPDNDESMTKAKKKSQLSPISENPPAEKLFGFTPDERKLLHYTKSEEKRLDPTHSDNDDYYDESDNDDDEKPVKLSNKVNSSKHSRSLDSLHCSQLPQEKLPLTKGLKVDGMVKRLSMDRFSPPLHFNSPAFSYTRPAGGGSGDQSPIVYAQVRRDENGEKTNLPSTIHRSTNLITRERSPIRNLLSSDTVDNVARNSHSPTRQTISTKFLNDKNRELHGNNNNYRSSPVQMNGGGDRHPTEYIHRIHLSDEDEGLGFDERKRFDDHLTPTRDIRTPTRDISRRSSSEPPIIPTLRPSYGSIEHLANRRKLLESKIHERSFDFGRDATSKPKLLTKTSPMDEDPGFNGMHHIRSFDERFPERNIVPPPRKQWAKQPKYYPETNLNDDFLSDMDTLRREQERQRHKTYLDRKLNEISTTPKNHVIDLGYIDQYEKPNKKIMNNNNSKIINQNLNYKHRTKGRAPQPQPQPQQDKLVNGVTHHIISIESDRRKLDKADSGIEHDFKRDHDYKRDQDHRRDDNNSRLRRLHLSDNIKEITDLFLKRECQMSESLHPSKKRYEFVFRERSIDDGSHFDPRLDKYPDRPKSQGTLTRTKPTDTKKSDKKFGTLKKMKELFSISSKKKSPSPPSSKSEVSHKEIDVEIFEPISPPQAIDIATRRRLSTPKASPIPKRIPSQKSSKISHISSHRSSEASSKPAPKTSWFKSLERLSRKKSADPKKTSVKRSNTTLSRPTYQRAQSPSPDFKPAKSPKNPQHLRFFGDTDLESLSKGTTTTRKRTPINAGNSQSMQNLRSNRSTNTRTLESDSSQQKVRGASSMQSLPRDVRSKYLPELSESTSENENQKPQAARIHHSTPNAKHKSRRQYHSMEYLENDKSSEQNRSEISQRPSRRPSRDVSRENSLYNEKNAEILHRSALRERNGQRSTSETRHLPPKAPTKPAREADRRRALSNERFLESSGTEGESSQQSVVYLHATTIGHIPQPYVASSRRSSKSREELSSIKSKSSSPMQQPMTRTVSRSVSMLAPWTPRHISDGYEINYSQTMQNPKKKSGSTMNRDVRGNHTQSRSKDDLSSMRSSSLAKTSTLPKHKK
ncbi:uncharacterized protein LOC129575331 isoform X2 [Sitodiplosis mosellana]|uniref:uncharacterized protein LOC129575331 isoform X2 n=1 Tax=Sitodiplosis mosellana TaxID=263140 RepID=UPI00244473ED|nr:uncharacterized protein LOC129575331 isoform X2 [Sitodiplosis mosellana]